MLAMRELVCLLVCLALVSHARRVQTSIEHLQVKPLTERESDSTSMHTRLQPNLSVGSIAMSNPAAAFAPSHPGLHHASSSVSRKAVSQKAVRVAPPQSQQLPEDWNGDTIEVMDLETQEKAKLGIAGFAIQELHKEKFSYTIAKELVGEFYINTGTCTMTNGKETFQLKPAKFVRVPEGRYDFDDLGSNGVSISVDAYNFTEVKEFNQEAEKIEKASVERAQAAPLPKLLQKMGLSPERSQWVVEFLNGFGLGALIIFLYSLYIAINNKYGGGGAPPE